MRSIYRTYLIVGSRHYPPALALIYTIPENTILELQKEPENKYDNHAVRIMLQTNNIPSYCHTELAEELIKYGIDINTVLSKPCHKLGYLPKIQNILVFNYMQQTRQTLLGCLSFIDDERPAVIILPYTVY